MPVATYSDVAVAIGRPISTTAEQQQISYWIDGTERFIKARFGDLAILDQGDLKYVVTEVVAAKVRRLANGGATSVTVGVDDGNVTRRFEGAVTSSDFTDEWWDLLEPAAAADAFTVSPYATRQQPIGSYRGDWPWR